MSTTATAIACELCETTDQVTAGDHGVLCDECREHREEVAAAVRIDRRKSIDALHTFADFLADNPDLPLPAELRNDGWTSLNIRWARDRADFVRLSVLLGATDLEVRGEQVFAYRMFGPIKVEIGISRDNFDGTPAPPPLPTLQDLINEAGAAS